MTQELSLTQIRNIFKNKEVDTFLNDVYNLSNSHKSRQLYRQILCSFNRFCLLTYDKDLVKLIEELKPKPLEDILDTLLQYKRYLDNHTTRSGIGISNSTKRVQLSVLKNFFRACGIKIHYEDIRDHIKIGRKMRVQKFALDPQTVAKIIIKVTKFQYKALSILLASTGMRVMEAITLQPSDFDFRSNPVCIRLRPKETKTNEGRTVYLTSECTGMMEQIINNKPESQQYLFGKSPHPDVIYRAYGRIIRNALRQLDLYKILDNGKNQITIHSFRSFFRTYAGHLISRDFAESFIGHRFYLSEYENMPEEEKKKLFLKLEPHITFSQVRVRSNATSLDTISLQEQIQDLEDKIRVLAQKFLADRSTSDQTLVKNYFS